MNWPRILQFTALAATLGAIVYLVAARRADQVRYREALENAEARFSEEREQLQTELDAVRRKAPKVVTKTVTVPAALPPAPTAREILQKLVALKSGPGFADIRAQRQAVVHLEALIGLGPQALPAIRAFLLEFDDSDYTADSRRPEVVAPVSSDDDNRQRRQFWQQFASGDRAFGHTGTREARLDFGVPPTLRIGLFDVLHAIGGNEAESILLEQLQRTGRGIEVAYLAHTLRDMSSTRYRDEILRTAHELIMAPQPADTGAGVDRKAKDYLYAILEMFDDLSFVPSAAQILVGTDGNLDHHAFDYLGRHLGENIVPILDHAWSNPMLTNTWDLATVAGAALPHAGTNAMAGQIIRSAIVDPNLPLPVRTKTLRAFEEFPVTGTQLPANAFASRIQLITGVIPEIADSELIQEAVAVRQRLQRAMAAARPPAASAAPPK